MITQIFSTHMTIDARSPITAITGTAAIINIQYIITIIGKQIVETYIPGNNCSTIYAHFANSLRHVQIVQPVY